MKNNSLLVTTIIIAVLSLAVTYYAYTKGKHVEGLITAKNITLQVVPLLVFAFLLAGMLQAVVPTEIISNWIGEQSGVKGIFIGSILGGLLPGGPYVTLPIIVGFAKVGASVPVLISILTGWSLIAVGRLPLELAILGPRLTVIRLLSVVIFAPLSGFLADFLIRTFKL